MLVTQLHNPTKLFVPCQRVNFPIFATRLGRFIVNALFSIYSSLTEKNGKLREKSLVRMTPGVNFINILPASFMRPDPKSTKR
jgi:hypothetical protein